VLRAGTLALAGLSLPDCLALQARGAPAGKAKHGIFVFLNGGPSQLDTFDPKPDAPDGIRGPYRPIATSVAGIRISERLPRLARLAGQYALVRSATHHLHAHNSGAAYALSGHAPASDADIAPTPMDHPSYGAVLAKLRPSLRRLPSAVLTPRLLFDMGFPTPSAGGGWLGHAYDPFPVVRNQMMSKPPAWDGKLPVPDGLRLPTDVSARRLSGRQELLGVVNDAFAAARANVPLLTLDRHQEKALDLLLSPEAQAAFDLAREPAAVHERYGRFEMGQVLLLARRLVEAGVRFVTANAVSNPTNTTLACFQIWDTHRDHFRLYDETLLPELDQALSALLTDLDERGLLGETLLVVMGEFGRTPRINANPGGGRDHWPHAYSVLLAGGGIGGGRVYGATDRHAAHVKDLPVRPDDLAATLYEALGVPHDTMLKDFAGRPHRITDGTPLTALFG
jgi:hypothetical protein